MELKDLRIRIDEIDNKILEMLNNRAEIVLEIGRLKQNEDMIIYHPDREEEICNRLVSQNKGILPDKVVSSIYREIISGCRSLESPLKIAYLGPEATFTHLAAQKKFGSSVEFIPSRSISDVFADVEKQRTNYGIVPIENSTEGVITHTLDMFIDSDLKICSEVLLEISHNLLSNSKFEEIKRVYSHPQAFAQTRNWLENNLNVEYIETSSTAEAAKLAAKETGTAAIASELAASIYNLQILRANIEDRSDNFTRFLVIGNNINNACTGHDKTSILFSVKDRVGVLHSILKPFATHKINLTKIESRPSRKQVWKYVFFLDLDGHIQDKNIKDALSELDELCLYLKVLGSYPVED